MGEGKFPNAYHLLVLREERRDGKKIQDDFNNSKPKELVSGLDGTNHRLILCAKNTGAWLNIWGTAVPGTVLTAT